MANHKISITIDQYNRLIYGFPYIFSLSLSRILASSGYAHFALCFLKSSYMFSLYLNSDCLDFLYNIVLFKRLLHLIYFVDVMCILLLTFPILLTCYVCHTLDVSYFADVMCIRLITFPVLVTSCV